jgi:hypothetical protein
MVIAGVASVSALDWACTDAWRNMGDIAASRRAVVVMARIMTV